MYKSCKLCTFNLISRFWGQINDRTNRMCPVVDTSVSVHVYNYKYFNPFDDL